MKKLTITLLLFFVSISNSFSQSKELEESVEFLNRYLKADDSKPHTRFNSFLKIEKHDLNYEVNIKSFHPMEYDKVVQEINHDVTFNKSNIQDYVTEVKEIDKEKHLYKIYTKVILTDRLPMNYSTKMYTDEESEDKIIQVIKIEISTHTPVEKENIEKYQKALKLLFTA